jgi:hypothetical protein
MCHLDYGQPELHFSFSPPSICLLKTWQLNWIILDSCAIFFLDNFRAGGEVVVSFGLLDVIASKGNKCYFGFGLGVDSEWFCNFFLCLGCVLRGSSHYIFLHFLSDFSSFVECLKLFAMQVIATNICVLY